LTTVAELIAELEALPGDSEVILAVDAEGNNYAKLDDFSEAMIDPTVPSRFVEPIFPGDWEEEHDDWDGYTQNAVVLWPV
jgi:hypothetical protein